MILRIARPLLQGSHLASSLHRGGGIRWSSASALPRLLFLDSIKLAQAELDELKQVADVAESTSKDRNAFIRDLGDKYEGVVGIYRHFGAARSIKVTGRFDQELVDTLPKSLKFIAHNGAGYDQIDVPACTSRGIQVSNVPKAVDAATADTALFLMLTSLRNFQTALQHAKDGSFNSKFPLAHDPAAKTVGIVGMGNIGRAFAARARAVGMKVIYHNRNRLDSELEAGAKYVSGLDELLGRSDVVSLHCPLTPATRHLMGTEQFRKMKKSAILINTARGPVVDEEALVAALEAGEIAGCGLDVYENEPNIPDALLNNPKAVCLPHIGTLTVETQREMEAVCLRNLMHGVKEGRLGFTVPEQKDMKV